MTGENSRVEFVASLAGRHDEVIGSGDASDDL